MNPEPKPKFEQLNAQQRDAIEQIRSGRNVMITGPAGTGKSFLLRFIQEEYPKMPITASTGIAALNVGGCTLHTWAKLSRGDQSAAQIANRLNERKDGVWIAMQSCEKLAIDEISMTSAETLDMLDEILRRVRKNNRPFGGVQLIVFGDFLQLPPVPEEGRPARFAFESAAWQYADFKVYLLTEVMRQKDAEFAGVLSRVRVGDTSEEVRSVLRPRINALDPNPSLRPTDLATHNELADGINFEELRKLETKECEFQASDSADTPYLMQKLDKDCIAPKTLTLKIGCQVMLLKNIDPQAGLVNGSIGRLVDLKEGQFKRVLPVVEFSNGVVREIERATWEMKRGKDVLASRIQTPLRPSYAITIHKAQGLTLEKVRVHLKRCFSDGQAYVALSRAKTLEGLFIAGISGTSIRTNPTALEFYRRHAA
jgi:ATP-dependent DNA helicase PIF1